MRELTPGHRYVAANFENPENGQTIQFIEKVKVDGVLQTQNDGTTNEEVIDVLIDRLMYLQGLFPCRENALAITKLEEAKMWLEKRTRDRVARGVEGKPLA